MSWIMWLELLFIIVGLSIFAIPGFSFAPWVPTRKKDLARILRLADLKEGEIFYELGCGNGRVSCFVADRSAARVIGIELSSILYVICRVRNWFHQNHRLSFYCKSLFEENLSHADVIYFFGMPDKIASRLKAKFEKELKPGARVISYVFPIEGWTSITVDRPTKNDLQIFMYQIGQAIDKSSILA
ncbi:class I SAM-dependent methyltransferase [Candidatus Uhrbacteria bacterium]|nr:class I SAM-dependent methyltransferase [Candidatus Uhrbacteria bacterium]